MRTLLAAPRRKFEALSAAVIGGLKHWRMFEAGTSADVYGGAGLAFSGGGTTPAPFYESDGTTLGTGRTFTTGVAGTSTATSNHRTAMRADNIAFEITFRLDSVAAKTGIFGLASTSVTASNVNNTAFALIAQSDGSLGVSWHSGILVQREIITPPGLIAIGTIYTVGIRRWISGTVVMCDFFVNGRFVHRGTNANVPAGATSANWRAGSVKTADFTDMVGTIYDIRVMSDTVLFNDANTIRSADFFRNDAARLLQAFDTSKIVKSLNYNAFARVLVENPTRVVSASVRDDGVFEELDGFERRTDVGSPFAFRHDILDAVDLEEDIDGEGMTASFTCAREYYDWRYSPLIASSPVTRASGERVFEVARAIQIEVAIVPADVARADVLPHEWQTVFDGFISSIDFGSDVMTIACRDRIAPVQWTFCRPLASNAFREKSYGADPGGVAIETVLQQIIDDHTPATGYKGGKPLVYTPTLPAWNLRKRNLDFVPLADALNAKVTQIGWVLRHKWDTNARMFRYTFFRPERISPVSSRTFGVDEYVKISAAALNEDTIRNVAEVVFGDDSGADTVDAPPRAREIVSDSVSIATYGERYCQITEDSSSQINDVVQATALATAVVSDLAQPKALITAELRAFPWADLNDYFGFGSRDHFDATEFFAVVKIRTHYGADRHSTSLSLRGKPSGRVDWWLGNMIAQPGLAPAAPFAPIAELPAVTTVALAGAIKVRWVWPASVQSSAFDLAEVHVFTGAGAWTPSNATLAGVTRSDQMVIADLAAGTALQAKVIYRDRNNNVTAAVAAANVTPRFDLIRPGVHAERLTAQSFNGVLLNTVAFNSRINGTDSRGDLNTGTGRFTVPVSGYYTLKASVNYTPNKTATTFIQIISSGVLSPNLLISPSIGPSGVTRTMETPLSPPYFLTAGDVIELFLVLDTNGVAGSQINAVAQTYMQIMFVSQP